MVVHPHAGGPTEVPFDCILFEELLHKGAFKIVHHAVVNYPERGMMSVPAAVKRLKGEVYTQTHTHTHTHRIQTHKLPCMYFHVQNTHTHTF